MIAKSCIIHQSVKKDKIKQTNKQTNKKKQQQQQQQQNQTNELKTDMLSCTNGIYSIVYTGKETTWDVHEVEYE